MKRRLIAGTINRYPAEEGWEHVHLDKSNRPLYDLERKRISAPAEIVCDLTDLRAIRRDSFDEVRCHQVLEHLTPENAPKAIAGFAKVLRTGGRLDLEVPDVLTLIRGFTGGELEWPDLLGNLYGGATKLADDHLNAHRWGWSEVTLREVLADGGFDPDRLKRIDSGSPYQLRIEAFAR